MCFRCFANALSVFSSEAGFGRLTITLLQSELRGLGKITGRGASIDGCIFLPYRLELYLFRDTHRHRLQGFHLFRRLPSGVLKGAPLFVEED